MKNRNRMRAVALLDAQTALLTDQENQIDLQVGEVFGLGAELSDHPVAAPSARPPAAPPPR
ncbi:MAG TPA: hypothetical protein VH374_14550 [Polyangia bacterium]|jgi:hypothetical protein|nr:hypothetical protein [Polyangia bacterium]